MPGQRCAVTVCNNSRIKTRDFVENRIYYHRFPKNLLVSKQWVKLCRKSDKSFNPHTAVICSVHFTPNDYERDLKAELLNLPPKTVLKPLSVPSLRLTNDTTNSAYFQTGITDREKRVMDREQKKPVEKICIDKNLSTDCTDEETYINEKNEIEPISDENKRLKEKIESLESKIRSDECQIKKLKKQNHILKRRANKCDSNRNKAFKILSSLFTQNQIDLILSKKRRVTWTSEEISLAFTLRYFSKRCFLFLKRKMKIPLPGLSTLQHWASRFEINEGLINSVFQYLEVAVSTLQAHERVVALQFDEIKVKRVMEYDTKSDRIVGPHSNMQVISARGLFSKWKQPLYINFDTQVSKDILTNVISKLKEIGYEVKACVSDMGGGNVGLWKQLNISTEKTYFTIPGDEGNKIYFFADAPHILKLIRNWFVDTGFELSDGSVVNKDPVAAMIMMDQKNDLRVCHKLSEEHLNLQKTQRQNVRKAVELMSHTTAAALKLYFKDDEVAQSTSKLIEIVDNWFDIMNSYCPRQFGPPFKKPYGQDLKEQNEVLDKMEDLMRTMRCSGKKKLQLFQKGCIISTMSLRELFRDLQEKYGARYLLTHRLNQDCLENLFSQIRTRGGLNDHPSPLEAVYRLRMIILGKTQGILQSCTNTNFEDDHTETIVSKVFRISGIKIKENYQDGSLNDLENEQEDSKMCKSCEEFKHNQECTDDALTYLSGWVARKYKTKYPYMEATLKKKIGEPIDSSSWLSHLSYGGLTNPSSTWLSQARILNEEFKTFHGTHIYKGLGVVHKLTNSSINKYPDIPSEVVQSFIRQRTFIRMKLLNEENNTKRRRNDSVDRRMKKKYKKLTS